MSKMSSANKMYLIATALALVCFIAVSAYSVQDPLEDDYYSLALANLLRQRQAALAGGPLPANSGPIVANMDKRACGKRGMNCSPANSDSCCEGNACRCNLFGSNCRCQRAGLFQKLI